MRPSQSAPTIRLSEYSAPPYWVSTVDLTFNLHPTQTRVVSEIVFTPNPDSTIAQNLKLDGQNLKLISASINGVALPLGDLIIETESLTVPSELIPQGDFTWSAEVEINPEANTALEGLYMSKGMYCTQCEAEGFRKITYYLDRPDVMATFDVTINGDQPILLSNGNKLEHGKWHDPWPKPAYLFALVAGDLVSYDDVFLTQSGRKVDLQIFVRDGDQGKCAYAMDALKRSMRWDEDVYGREYDLDLFMIVAVDDFNMGAMENKGLNIFNSKYVLASPETATDLDYELIEGIIAHEYFHNWTGNRITCRDWFQLCLKEGLTVFRDQQFSGDQRSHAVKRIDDVLQLRARQFREDAGPLAHPVRPEEYIEINNFYTATVYEKGAEVIGMLKLIVGDDAYDEAVSLYFDRHDGQACTIEQWISVFEDTTGQDLTQFALWYSQSGTPRVAVDESFEAGTYTIKFAQSNPPTPGQFEKKPQVVPIRFGLLAADGTEAIDEQIILLNDAEQTLTFDGLSERPIASILRGFSAPVILERPQTSKDQLFLLANDTDPFNKWEAGRGYALEMLAGMAQGTASIESGFLEALHKIAIDTDLDPAFRSLVLSLPSDDSIAQAICDRGGIPDPSAIYTAKSDLSQAMADQMTDDLMGLYLAMDVAGPYNPEAESAGKRALRSTILGLMTKMEPDARSAKAQFATANNMTESLSALSCLIRAGHGADAVSEFYSTWQNEKLVIDKWFAIQVGSAKPDVANAIAHSLANHSEFDWKNPNRFRSLIGPYATNHAAFHQEDGSGYEFVADWLIKLDGLNPQTTARMCGLFESWKRYDTGRQAKMLEQLKRIAAKDGLSKDASEIVGKILG